MRLRRAMLGLVFLALVGAAAILLLGDSRVDGHPPPTSREEARSESPGPVRLEGGGDATRPPRVPGEDVAPTARAGEAARRDLHGIVRAGDGAPIAGAVVYVADKFASEPEKEETFRRVTTDAEGRWRLDGVVVRGHWIRAVADGYLPADLDGDLPPTKRTIVFELEPGPEIRVTVTTYDGKPLEHTFYVYVRNGEWGRCPPGPDGSLEFRMRADIAPGEREARFRLCTRSEVEVHGHYPHGDHYVEPSHQRIRPPRADVRILVVKRCVLDLRVIDAASGAPLPRRLRVRLGADTRYEHGGRTKEADGRYREYVRVPIGTYRLRVEAVGFRTHDDSEVTFTRPGEVVSVEVRMERDPTVGDLRVSLPILPTLPPEPTFYEKGPRPQARFLYLVPGDAGRVWADTWGEPGRASDTDYLLEGRPAGEVGLLVINVGSRRVAYAPHVRVRAGRTTSITLDLEPGIYVDPETFRSLYERIEGATVRHPGFGAMPTLLQTENQFNWGEPGGNFLPSTPWGPYPGPEVTVELQLDDGEVVTRTFGRGADDR